MAEEKIKINMADEGGWFNWADEVEEEIPLGARVPPPSGWSTVEVVKKKPAEKILGVCVAKSTTRHRNFLHLTIPIAIRMIMERPSMHQCRV